MTSKKEQAKRTKLSFDIQIEMNLRNWNTNGILFMK